MDLVTQIFEAMSSVIEKFAAAIQNVFESVVPLFYTAPSGSNSTGSLTILGILLIVAVSTGLVMWAFRTIRGLVRRA